MREQAERIAARIPNINLRANKIAESIWTGLHSRKKVGPGESFWQFRKYEHGDPAQLIDWRRTAKTNEIFIQERELETVQNIWNSSTFVFQKPWELIYFLNEIKKYLFLKTKTF